MKRLPSQLPDMPLPDDQDVLVVEKKSEGKLKGTKFGDLKTAITSALQGLVNALQTDKIPYQNADKPVNLNNQDFKGVKDFESTTAKVEEDLTVEGDIQLDGDLTVDGDATFGSMPFVGSAPIVESGSNANGEYVKYADGTLICTGGVKIVYNNGYTLRGTWAYPSGFSSNPIVVGTPSVFPYPPINVTDYQSNVNRSTEWLSIQCGAGAPTTSTANVQLGTLLSSNGFISGDYAWAYLIAIGRWK